MSSENRKERAGVKWRVPAGDARAHSLLPLPPLFPFLFYFLFVLLWPSPARGQDTPTLTIDDECMAAAYAPDGRMVYAVRHVFNTRRLEMQRDDIWLVGVDGKRRRIVSGEKLVRGNSPFSYTVQSFRWAPDGARLTAELLTTQMIDSAGTTRDGVLTLLLDQDGKEIRIAGADSVIPDGVNGAWLGDGVTVVYLVEKVKPKLLYSINSVRPVAGRGRELFPDRLFAAVAWHAKQNAAVAIERDRSFKGQPQLVWLDLLKESRRELATLEGYAGGLTISPSGTKVAYYRDPSMLEIREIAAPDRTARLRATLGVYQWSHDERRILLKRAPERKAGDLVWLDLPPLEAPQKQTATAPAVAEVQPQPALHGLTFRGFELSPDSRLLAVIVPGKRNLQVYAVQ